MPRALIFASPDTLFDLAAAVRDAWSVAFAEAGLAWDWSPAAEAALGDTAAARELIEGRGREQDLWVDPEAIQGRMQAALEDRLRTPPLPLRPGAGAVLAAARAQSVALGLVAPEGCAAPAGVAVFGSLEEALPALGAGAAETRAVVAGETGAREAAALGLSTAVLGGGRLTVPVALDAAAAPARPA